MADEKLPDYGDVEKDASRTGSLPAQNILKHSKDADEAMKAFEGHEGEALAVDEATYKRLLRKIDRNILPVHRGMWRAIDSEDSLLAAHVRRLWPQLS